MCSNMLMSGLSHLQVEIQVISGTWVWVLTHDSLTCEIHLLITRSRRVLIQIAIGAHAWKAKTNSNRLHHSEMCYWVFWVMWFLHLTRKSNISLTHSFLKNSIREHRECILHQKGMWVNHLVYSLSHQMVEIGRISPSHSLIYRHE